ncbi:uncharacterized protein LOC132935478 [Metopolophium dirhodum]|uniref:uncharacterized protein LOC132935478 n=1 Tax=Metopolophium dirhodum TaxID=44670 RepID=UPI0029902CD4|nr:uncharacterized protein LOC132935478 [Metopolophium dirhodum]XP_060858031.1 uncharacterized protein LOC132935478 [Metopolophium dirhodum]
MDGNQENTIKKALQLIRHLEFLQYSFFDGRPEWTTIKKNDLKLFMAYTYYDYPLNDEHNNDLKDIDGENLDDIFILYNNEIQKSILTMVKKIEKFIQPNDQCSSIEVGVTITYSICKIKCKLLDTTNACCISPDKDIIHQWKLIRIKVNSQVFFVDFIAGRTYKNWDDYMENNTLPEGNIFYPKSGIYDETNSLIPYTTPASRKSKKILKNVDLSMRLANAVGGLSLIYGLLNPMTAPLVIFSAASLGSSSIWETGREIQNLIDIYRHKQCLTVSQLCKEWVKLSLTITGAVTALLPVKAIASVTTEVKVITNATKLGKSMALLQKGVSITRYSLEIIHTTLNIMDKKSKLRWEDALSLSLDLFVITGSLAPIKDIQNIIIGMSSEAVCLPIFKTMETFPYYLSQHFWKSVYFFKMHFEVFAERVVMFLLGKLTLDNLLFAWQKIYHLMNVYQKQMAALDDSDLLRHVVDGITADERLKYVLRGPHISKLLDGLRREAMEKPVTHRAQVKYCVDRIMREVKKLSSLHDDSLAELTRLGEAHSKVNEEFCKMFGLDRCTMDQYAKWAIFEVGRDPAALLAEYREHASLPENKYNDLLLYSNTLSTGRSIKAYSLLAPCSALELESCVQFANMIYPQPHGYRNHKFVQSPDEDISFLVLSSEIVFFGVKLFDGVPKMNVCFYG